MIKYKLGDIVNVVSEREDNPSNCKYNKFVGLEHYNSGEVEIKNYGNTHLLKSAMKVFNAGDILIARRNVYLKRASVVNFDGITSGDSIVLRANDGVIKKLLPFVLNTDNFWEYAEKFSDGTMSKRLSPKVLLEYEFNLPDITEQEKLAELLWTANDTKEAYKNLLSLTDDLVKAQFVDMFGDPVLNPMELRVKTLGELGTLKNGMNFSRHDTGVTINCLGVGDFQNHSEIRDTSSLPKISLNELPSEEYLLRNKDVVFVRSNGNKALVGRSIVVYPENIKTTFSGFCIRFRLLDENIDINYLIQALHYPSLKNKLLNSGRGANITNLNQKMLSKLEIPIPTLDAQKQFANFVQQTYKSKYELQQTISRLEDTIKSLMQQYVG
ncbi:restriction endonuclease subunit S [Priestia megaterium]|uniref:restriction endonuclease subunit S n=1 Tax=Priestia megaterium TaxID=1404 RepID=UPI002FFFE257